jgi:hypothetical protein
MVTQTTDIAPRVEITGIYEKQPPWRATSVVSMF